MITRKGPKEMHALESFFEKITSLPMMPKVIQEVLKLMEDDDVDIDSVIKRISMDQVLTAKVLRLSNSSYYGRSGSIKTLNEALQVTGLQNLKTLVVASGITAAFSNIEGVDLNSFWKNSLVSANLARQISKEHKMDTEVSYLAGLMHSIGQLPIYMVEPTIAAEVDQELQGADTIERNKLEFEKLSVNHAMIGAEIAKRWNFPEQIQLAIRYYSDPFNTSANDTSAIVYLATHIAYQHANGLDSTEIAESLNDEVAESLKIDRNVLADSIDEYKALINESDLLLAA